MSLWTHVYLKVLSREKETNKHNETGNVCHLQVYCWSCSKSVKHEVFHSHSHSPPLEYIMQLFLMTGYHIVLSMTARISNLRKKDENISDLKLNLNLTVLKIAENSNPEPILYPPLFLQLVYSS